MTKAVYPGTFDPMTYGHMDVIRRATQLFDEVIIGVLHNSAKTPLFSVEERVNILKKATKEIHLRSLPAEDLIMMIVKKIMMKPLKTIMPRKNLTIRKP